MASRLTETLHLPGAGTIKSSKICVPESDDEESNDCGEAAISKNGHLDLRNVLTEVMFQYSDNYNRSEDTSHDQNDWNT